MSESAEVKSILQNEFNLKVDIVDENQANFTLAIEKSGIVNQNDKTITAINYGETKAVVTHTATGNTKEIMIEVINKMESIVQGFRDINFADGKHTVLVKDKLYDVEVINIYGDTTYSLENGETSRIVLLGDDSKDYRTLVVKYHGNLTIDEGVTVTANTSDGLTYKKGMYLCVLGDIKNNGNISMTARGTYNQEGENVYLWKNIDNSYEYVPADRWRRWSRNKDNKKSILFRKSRSRRKGKGNRWWWIRSIKRIRRITCMLFWFRKPRNIIFWRFWWWRS